MLMNGVVVGAVVVAVLSAAWLVIRARYRLPTPSDETHRIATADGWELAAHRYRPATPVPGREPVILCHGMLSNRFNVDLDAGRSLARYLRGRGFDVWVMELRGHGASRRAGAARRRFDWTLDDYVLGDLPAVLGYVRKATGAERVHWFGHSMGGMILYAACVSPAVTGAIRSAVLSDAPATFAPLRARARVARLYGRLLPVVPPALVLPFLGPIAWLAPGVLRRHGLPGRRLLMSVLANAIIPWGSSRVLLQICDMVESGRFRSRDGTIDYEEGARRIEFPLLVVSAARKLMKEEAILFGVEQAASAEKEYLRFSRANGYAADYTHASLLVGDSASAEVFPVIAGWFERHSPA